MLNWTMIGAIGQTVAALTTIFVLIFLALQIRSGTKIARADFIFRLEGEFQARHVKAYQKFRPEGSWGKISSKTAKKLTEEEIVELQHYISFFENLQALRSDGLINLKIINKRFAYRFFIAMHNQYTYDIIRPNKNYWELLFLLYNDWKNLREKNGEIIPNSEFSCEYTSNNLA